MLVDNKKLKHDNYMLIWLSYWNVLFGGCSLQYTIITGRGKLSLHGIHYM